MVHNFRFKLAAVAASVLAIGVFASACGQTTEVATIQVTADESQQVLTASPSDVATTSAAVATPLAATAASDQEIVLDGSPDPGDEIPGEVLSHKADYQRYKAINPDVIGWISVPNTRIEYPVVMAADNDYYLSRNVEKERSKSGAIFMDWRNANPEEQRHLVIYGHNMNNGTMFNGLNSYKKKDFFDNNQKIYFYWGDGEPIEYEVYAAFNVDVDIDFIKVKFNSDQDFLDTANSLKSMSKFTRSPDVALEPDDQIITLATCTYEYDNQRFVVQARKAKS